MPDAVHPPTGLDRLLAYAARGHDLPFLWRQYAAGRQQAWRSYKSDCACVYCNQYRDGFWDWLDGQPDPELTPPAPRE